MPRLKTVVLLAIIVIFFTITASALSEVVVLKDGSKYILNSCETGNRPPKSVTLNHALKQVQGLRFQGL